MIPTIVLIARLLSAPVAWVALVLDAATDVGNDPVLSVSRVEWECRFDPTAEGVCSDGSTDWGWAQFNSTWHDQHRGDLRAHVAAMEDFQALCNRRAHGDPRLGLAVYHRWVPDALGMAYAESVLQIAEIVRSQGRITPRTSGGEPRIYVYHDAGAVLEPLDGSAQGGARDKGSRTAFSVETVFAILPERLVRLFGPAGRFHFERKERAA
ncbi:MAG: hypothetical protein WC455_15960 [Dehalococcoidia bacterium]